MPRKLQHVQGKFVALRQSGFFTHDHVTYKAFLKFFKPHNVYDRRLHLDALFFISLY
jgi:hypothetical protein